MPKRAPATGRGRCRGQPSGTLAGRGESPVAFYNLYEQSLFGLVLTSDSPIQEAAGVTAIRRRRHGGWRRGPVRWGHPSRGRAHREHGYTFLKVGDGDQAAAAILRGDVTSYAAAILDTEAL